MKAKEFEYEVRFGEEYISSMKCIEKAVKLAKQLKKNLKEQGKAGFYSIYYLNIEIAQI